MCVVGTVCDVFCTEIHYTLGYSTFTVVVALQRSQDFSAILIGGPQGGLEIPLSSRISHKSRPEIAWNLCSRQVYPITLDARLIFDAITQLFSSNSRFHALKYESHHAFPLGGPLYLPHTLITWHNMFISLGSSYNQQKADPVAVIFRGWKRKRNFAVLFKKSKKAARFVLNC